jgi:hypothetical protein
MSDVLITVQGTPQRVGYVRLEDDEAFFVPGPSPGGEDFFAFFAVDPALAGHALPSLRGSLNRRVTRGVIKASEPGRTMA